MRKLIFLSLVCILNLYSQESRLIENPIRKIPKWIRNVFSENNLDQKYTIIYNLYPYYLKGDFNGDRKKDIVIQLLDNNSKKTGIGIFFRKKPQELQTQVFIIGADNKIKNAGDDFKWIKTWSIYNHPDLKGSILLEDKEGNQKCIYWDGSKFVCETCN